MAVGVSRDGNKVSHLLLRCRHCLDCRTSQARSGRRSCRRWRSGPPRLPEIPAGAEFVDSFLHFSTWKTTRTWDLLFPSQGINRINRGILVHYESGCCTPLERASWQRGCRFDSLPTLSVVHCAAFSLRLFFISLLSCVRSFKKLKVTWKQQSI